MSITRPFVPAALFAIACATAMFFNGTAFVPLSVSLVLLLLAFGMAAGKRVVIPWRAPLTVPLLAFALWWFAVTLWSPAPQVAFHGALLLGVAPLTYLVFVQPGARSVAVRATFAWLVVGSALLLGYSLTQYYAGSEPVGFFLNKNLNAGLLNLLVLPWVAAVLVRFGTLTRTHRGGLLLLAAAHSHLLALVGSRGALLAFVASLLLVLSLERKALTRPALLWTLGAVAVGLLSGEALSGGYLHQRALTLIDPAAAGGPRFVIWEGALELLRDVPWYGIGAGLFAFAYAPYRLPADFSFGAYAHNDYLQFAIEGGIPAILAVLAIVAATVVSSRAAGRGARGDRPPVPPSGLAAGLLSVLLHSALTFNLYVAPTLMVIGLYLATLSSVYLGNASPVRARMVNPAFFLWGLLAFGILQTGAIGYSTHLQELAIDKSRTDAGEAEHYLIRASRLTPGLDQPYGIRAWLYIGAVDRNVENDQPVSEFESLYQKALQFAEEAIRRNPLAAENHYIRAQALIRNPDRGQKPDPAVLEAFERVIALAPAKHKFRFGYVSYLALAGDPGRAAAVLESGREYQPLDEATRAVYQALTEELQTRIAGTNTP